MCKNTIFLFIILACFVLPTRAQKSDGFFLEDELYIERNDVVGFYNLGTQIFGSDVNGGFNITTQQFGETVPIGGGLLILLGTGFGYAALKRKRR